MCGANFIFLLTSMLLAPASSQTPIQASPRVTLSVNNKPLCEVLKRILRQGGANYLIAQDITPDPAIDFTIEDKDIKSSLLSAISAAGQSDRMTVEERDGIWIVRPNDLRMGERKIEPFKLTARFNSKDLRYCVAALLAGVRRNWSMDVGVLGTVTDSCEDLGFDQLMWRLLRKSTRYAWYWIEEGVVVITCDPTRERKRFNLATADAPVSTLLRSLCDQDRVSYVIVWPAANEPHLDFKITDASLEDALDKIQNQLPGDLGPAVTRYRDFLVLSPRKGPKFNGLEGRRVSLMFRRVDVRQALERLLNAAAVDCEIDLSVSGPIDASLRDLSLQECIQILCDLAAPRLAWSLENGTCRIKRAATN